MTRRIATYSVLLAWAGVVFSCNVLALSLPSDSERAVSLADDIEFFIAQQPLSAQQLIQNEPAFSALPNRYIDLGRTRNTVWLRVKLVNPEPAERIARLDTGRQYIEWLHIYVVRSDAPDTPELIFTASSTDTFSVRPIKDLLLMTDINFAPNETLELLVAYRSVDTTWMPLHIGSARALDEEHSTTVTIDWLLNGALLAMVCFALLMGPVIGWRLAGSFAIYILTATAYVAHADGYTFRYLWPNAPGSHDAVRLFLISLMPVTALNFVQQLFDFSQFRWLVRSMRALMIATGCAAIGAYWIVQNAGLMTAAYLLIPMSTLIQVTAGIVALQTRQLGSFPFTLGALFVCSSFIYAAVAHLQPGAWDVDFTLDYGHLALFGETISFGIAIALRLKGLRADAAHARSLAEDRQLQLDALNHDIKQPLVALREGIAKLESGDLHTQMTAAFNYLESLAKHGPMVDKGDETDSYSASIMLDGIKEMFEDEARNRGVSLRVANSDIPLNSDPIALMRIVSNLVANAIEHGGDLVEVKISQTEPIIISVCDNGAGLDNETLQQQLQRGSSSSGDEQRGLGLDIVKSVSDSIEAVFTIESSPGSGTRALVELPTQPS